MSNYSTSNKIPADLYKKIERRALAVTGDRVSVRKLLEDLRASGEYAEKINNDVAPQIARRLIADHPHLGDVIETRALGKRGRNVTGKPAPLDRPRNADLALVLAHLPADISVVSLSMVADDAAGTMRTIDVSRLAAYLRRKGKK